MNEYRKLCEDLEAAGIRKGVTVMIHSSFKSLGCTSLNPDDVIDSIQEVVTEEGTVLMPALSYSTVTRENPYFSYNNTESCVGVISETFRKRKGVIRSVNPVHSVSCWGKNAEKMTEKHYLDSISIGPNSPYMLLPKYNGLILMLGCGLKPNTFMHGVENIAKVPYREIKYMVNYTIVDRDGSERAYLGGLPDMSSFDQRYDRIKNILQGDELKEVKILNSTSYLINSKALLEKAKRTLTDNPYYFVDKL